MEKILNKIVGERIRTTRTDKGLKQSDLAKVIDSTSALISNIENGNQSIQLFDLYKISELLEKEVNYFLPSLQEVKEAIPSIDKKREKLSPKEAAVIDSLRKQIKEEE
jgi:transcriptional regulator with XRE-family HTH domain